MIPIIVIAVAFGALGFTLLSLRRAQEKIEVMEGDIDAVEGHNRTLQEQRDALKTTLAETSSALDASKSRLQATEDEKQELERQRAALAENASRLEKARADLEMELAKLRREQESLERRVTDFQGTWSHQLTTLEAEISTLLRQLGEYQKSTQLPIVKGDGNLPAVPSSPAAADTSSPPASVGPRLAGARPRALNTEPAADSAPARGRH